MIQRGINRDISNWVLASEYNLITFQSEDIYIVARIEKRDTSISLDYRSVCDNISHAHIYLDDNHLKIPLD